ncbi:MAG: N-acetyl-gamma-glutamyl-phosphate reductase [Gemmatimonadaceae bacterium]
MHRIPIGILGASGYAGRELCRLVTTHPGLRLLFATANERRGESARFGGAEVTFLATEDAPLSSAALVFSALPHGASRAWIDRVRMAGVRAVDLSADLRPGNDGAAGVPYGLPELRRAELRGAELIANPGCYPTAVLLALAPLFAEELVHAGSTITVNAASGVTGAGNAPKADLLFAEVIEDFRAYAVGNEHRHIAEMQATARSLGADADILFTPHLLPVSRGILATITVEMPRQLPNPSDLWQRFYAGEPFVEIREQIPALRDVLRRNVVRIAVRAAAGMRRPTLVILSAIDNLMKGAAGQAVQNANLALGIPESMGLPQ